MLDRDERNFVLQRIFIPLEDGAICGPLTAARQLARNGLAVIAATFHSNVQAVFSSASVPFRLTVASVQHLRWQQLVIAERIRARNLLDAGTPEEEAERIAVGIANERMAAELQSEAELFGDRVLKNLREALDEAQFADGAAELLRQCTVITWSAIEVLCQEVFVGLLNTSPNLVLRLSSNESTKKLFPLKSISFETLVEHAFDLSEEMGGILVQLRAIDSIPVMRSTFSALLPTADKLHAALGDRALWILNQRRHLIVHKRGVIDREYLERTGENLDVGQQLAITPSELETYLRVVIGAGSELLSSAAAP